jgi:hypothetical protein
MNCCSLVNIFFEIRLSNLPTLLTKGNFLESGKLTYQYLENNKPAFQLFLPLPFVLKQKVAKNSRKFNASTHKLTHPRKIFMPTHLQNLEISIIKASLWEDVHGWCEPSRSWLWQWLACVARFLKVGIRGDFSFATFICMAGKEKLSHCALYINKPASKQLPLKSPFLN